MLIVFKILISFQLSGSPFTDCDVSIFEAFAIFCGLGIHNTQMYENACKLMAKQKVALECLSYHATASQHTTEKLTHDPIQGAESYNLYSFKFIGKFVTDKVFKLLRNNSVFMQTSTCPMTIPVELPFECSSSAIWWRNSKFLMM